MSWGVFHARLTSEEVDGEVLDGVEVLAVQEAVDAGAVDREHLSKADSHGQHDKETCARKSRTK